MDCPSTMVINQEELQELNEEKEAEPWLNWILHVDFVGQSHWRKRIPRKAEGKGMQSQMPIIEFIQVYVMIHMQGREGKVRDNAECNSYLQLAVCPLWSVYLWTQAPDRIDNLVAEIFYYPVGIMHTITA